MGTVRALVMLTAGAALGASAVITHRAMQETGKSFQEAIEEVPAEFEKVIRELRIRALQLIENEREAYTSRQDRVERSVESVAGQQ